MGSEPRPRLHRYQWAEPVTQGARFYKPQRLNYLLLHLRTALKSCPKETGQRVLTRRRGLEDNGDRVSEHFPLRQRRDSGPTESDTTKPVPSGRQCGHFLRLRMQRRQRCFDHSGPREQQSDKGTLANADDEVVTSVANLAGNGYDSVEEVLPNAF